MGGVPYRQFGRADKKLIGAARRWAGADANAHVDDNVVRALAAFGACDADLRRANELKTDSTFQVFPENWEAVNVFLALATQWRMVGVATFGAARIVQTGIDYVALEPVMRLMGIKRSRRAQIFARIRLMEDAALEVIMERLQ